MTDPWPLRSSLELGALSTAVPCACLHVKHVLWEWGLNSLAESAVLLVSELERRRRERRCRRRALGGGPRHPLELVPHRGTPGQGHLVRDRKSTRLNSSHPSISYAVFCLKKKRHI